MTFLRLEHLRFAFGGGPPVVNDVCLELEAGEFFCLLGPSGSGKSTLLRLIGGYLPPEAGLIFADGHDITKLPPERRQMGIVFQNYALFPHLNALDNVAFGLRVRGVARAQREAKAREMLSWVGLKPAENHRLPSQLSGGQQQRVALARALAFGPGLLMLDEPFANLDRALRERLREELREIQRRFGITTIFVTHDREEAFALSDRLAVMQDGRLLQIGTPMQLYRQPGSAAVAALLGHRNVFEPDAARLCGLAGCVLLWPEKLRLRPDGVRSGSITRVTFAGTHQAITLRLDAGPEVQIHVPVDSDYRLDGRAALDIPAEAITRIDGEGSTHATSPATQPLDLIAVAR